MTGTEFKQLLKTYNLTVNRLLDLRDEWNRLSAEERYFLLKAEDTNENTDEMPHSNDK